MILTVSETEHRDVSSKLVLLVRHGDYKKWEQECNKTLTPCGRSQAKNTGEAICLIPELPNITKITSSTMIRAVQTADIITDIIKKDSPEIHSDRDEMLVEGDPETLNDKRRFQQVFDKYFVPAQGSTTETHVVICHGNIIRYFLCRYMYSVTNVTHTHTHTLY